MDRKNRFRQSLPQSLKVDNGLQRRQHWVGLAALALIGFVLASQTIRLSLPKSVVALDIPLAKQKLQELKSGGPEYDVVFLGSSRVYRGIDPLGLEAAARFQGCRIKSYNFGIPGLSVLEQVHLLEWINAIELKIKSIIVEPYSVPARHMDQFLSDRMRYFYEWRHLRDLFIDLITSPIDVKRKITGIRYLSISFIREQIGVGRLSSALFPVNPAAEDGPFASTRRGFRPLDEELGPAFRARQQHFSNSVKQFERKVKDAIKNPNAPRSSGNRFELVMRLVEKVQDLDARPGVIFMPQIASVSHARDLEKRLGTASAERVDIINLNNPTRYRNVFNRDNWFDSAHLNAKGATVLAQQLAVELCNQGH